MHLLHTLNVLGGLAWDPQIRGFLITVAAIAILPGTIYLLIATNVGARMGFLLAIAGLTGWMTVLGITWAFYGQGIKGRDPSWKVQEVVHSTQAADLSTGTTKSLSDFPAGKWTKLPEAGSPILGDAVAAVDNFITKSGRKPKMSPEGPVIKDPTPTELRYPAEFSESTDYIVLGGYDKGGNNCLGPKGRCTAVMPEKILFWRINHAFFFRHSPHYVVVQVQPVLDQEPNPDGTPVTPKADPTKPVTSIVVLRDLGSVRFPQVMMAIGSAILFGVTCLQLHRRDKKIMAMRAAGTPATA